MARPPQSSRPQRKPTRPTRGTSLIGAANWALLSISSGGLFPHPRQEPRPLRRDGPCVRHQPVPQPLGFRPEPPRPCLLAPRGRHARGGAGPLAHAGTQPPRQLPGRHAPGRTTFPTLPVSEWSSRDAAGGIPESARELSPVYPAGLVDTPADPNIPPGRESSCLPLFTTHGQLSAAKEAHPPSHALRPSN
jgi:hypothetical protein